MIDTSTHLDHHIKLRAEFYSYLPVSYPTGWLAVSPHYGLRGNLPLVFGRQHGHEKKHSFKIAYRQTSAGTTQRYELPSMTMS